jgi:hypothetical protein
MLLFNPNSLSPFVLAERGAVEVEDKSFSSWEVCAVCMPVASSGLPVVAVAMAGDVVVITWYCGEVLGG